MRRNRTTGCAIGAAILSLVLSSSAVAALRVEPRLTLRGEYDTNIISLGYEGVDGGIILIDPSIGIQLNVYRTSLMLDLGIDVWRYIDLDPNDGIDLTQYDTEVPFAKLSLARPFAGNMNLDAGAGYRRDLTMTHRYAETSNDYFRVPADHYAGDLKFSWNVTTRAKLQAAVNYGRVDYREYYPVGDSVGVGGDLSLGYQLTEKISFGGGVAYRTREYEPNDDTEEETSLSGQVAYRLSRLYSVEAKGSVDYLEPGAGLDPATLWQLMVIARREGPKTVFAARAHRNRAELREDGGVPQADGIGLTVTYKPSARISIEGGGSFDRVNYSAVPLEDADRRDDFIKATVRVTYEAHKNIFVRGDYTYLHRDSNDDFYDYGNHQVGISLVGYYTFR